MAYSGGTSAVHHVLTARAVPREFAGRNSSSTLQARGVTGVLYTARLPSRWTDWCSISIRIVTQSSSTFEGVLGRQPRDTN
jgi:hypothetical protein